jgi:serine/threonine-protein kinase
MTAITDRLAAALADRYRIERELGAGGMATVYLAHDLRHDRQVALKLLRPELGAILGGDRFLQEIKVTANLQHPHILPLFDSGSADGLLFYVMPFVEGETLRERLDREKQLPVAEAVRIASEVASALDYAHRHGVIHRDIKPENILLHDNRALVADFGIALAVRNAGGSRLTETGLSLGTPHYMSPEQATGDRELDARTDVYAVGCVLYEMLTGAPPYTGPTAQAVITKLVTEEAPPVTGQRRSVPPHVAAAVHRALEKLPADRLATAAEFARALDAGGRAEGPSGGRAPRPVGPARRPAVLPWSLVAAASVAIGVLGLLVVKRPATATGDVVRAILELPRGTSLSYPSLALSRDGSHIVVAGEGDGRNRLFQRQLDELHFTAVPGSEDGARQFLSPDGAWVAFGAGERMLKVPIAGGPAVEVARGDWAGGDWTDDGTIVYTPNYVSGLWKVAASGGTPERLTAPDSTRGELAHWWPQVLPDGEHVLFTAFSTPIERARLEVLSLKTGERSVVLDGAVSGRYVRAGYLLYARNEALFAVPFDLGRLAVTGQPVPVIQDLALQAEDGRAGFAVSDNGTLAYIMASSFTADLELVWVTRRGAVSAPVTAPARFDNPALSPNGRQVAIAIALPGETRDVWVLDLVRGTRTPITSGGANDFAPLFTPDGRRIIYESERPAFDLYVRPADASAPPTPLLVSPHDKSPGSITPDGSTLLFSYNLLPSQLWTVELADSGSARLLLASGTGRLRTPRVAPTGRWLAYVSEESGRREVHLSPYPDVAGSRQQVSADGGDDPFWTRGGQELVYRSGQRMMAVAVDPATGELGAPTELFRGAFSTSTFGSAYAVTPDGERFLMLRRAPGTEPRQVVVVTNWFRELERLVPK